MSPSASASALPQPSQPTIGWAHFDPDAPLSEISSVNTQPVAAATAAAAAAQLAQDTQVALPQEEFLPPVAIPIDALVDLDAGLSDVDEDEDMDRIAPLLRRRPGGAGMPAMSSTDTLEDWCFEHVDSSRVGRFQASRVSIHRCSSASESRARIAQRRSGQAAAAAQAAAAQAAGDPADAEAPPRRQKFGSLPFGHRYREPRGSRIRDRIPLPEWQRQSATPTTATISVVSSSNDGYWSNQGLDAGSENGAAGAAPIDDGTASAISANASAAGLETASSGSAGVFAAAPVPGDVSPAVLSAALSGEALAGEASRSLRRLGRSRTSDESSAGTSDIDVTRS
jgi:hypothetical protein